MNIGHYEDGLGEEFKCEILACDLAGEKYLIKDIDENEIGWCSMHLVNDDCFTFLFT